MSFNDYNATKSTRNVLGGIYDVKITSTYFLYDGKHRTGMLNCGKAKHANKEVSVYVLGVNEPVTEFHGQVIAIAKDRQEVLDDIWIAVPDGIVMYEPRLINLLDKYIPGDRFKYVCYYEKSCGAVMYTKKDGKRKYILITNISGHIGFPKGHIESGENEKQTALREIYEETGVKTKIIDGFRESYNYLINGFIKKKAVYFLAEFDEEDIQMNIREISEYRLVSFEEAYDTLNFKHDKDILKKADKFADELEANK